MKRTLIIKLGALGDVIRTTPLLRVLQGEITWVTSTSAMPFLSYAPQITSLLAVDDPAFRLEGKYDLVINLEDDLSSAQLATTATRETVIGPYLKEGEVVYDERSSEWFDMSLSSRYGRVRADQLKLKNRKTYQEMIFSALGLTFRGEDPVLCLPLQKPLVPGLVGIEARAGGVWPTKQWRRFGEVAERLEGLGYGVTFFQQRDSVVNYADDINQCEYVICADTLAMHLGLALGKSVVALFTCTSPWEIYGYGRLAKVVSPRLEQFFYQRAYSAEPGDAISVAAVMDSFQIVARHSKPCAPVDHSQLHYSPVDRRLASSD
ncbi:MAG TPA: glycosyltransferase family 9 protein [Bryobacteraceae bacterium]|jgi:heptosyltransferase-2